MISIQLIICRQSAGRKADIRDPASTSIPEPPVTSKRDSSVGLFCRLYDNYLYLLWQPAQYKTIQIRQHVGRTAPEHQSNDYEESVGFYLLHKFLHRLGRERV